MKYFLLSIVLCLNLFSAGGIRQPETGVIDTAAGIDAGIRLESKSAILMDASTGEVLFEKNADEALRPASVTKVMTLLLIFEQLENNAFSYDDLVTVSAHAAGMGGSQCFFEEGEQQTVRDMIKCIEVASGNDAAVAMAEYVGGSEEAFVELMNKKAKELGMTNTHFDNACGLNVDTHLTSARDIAIMSRELTVKHPEIFEFSNIWMDSIIHKTRRGESKFDLANTNKFLRSYNGATGLKTGYTSAAKYCISATASRAGINLICVIMGAPTKEIRNAEVKMLLDYGFNQYTVYQDDNVLPDDMEIAIKDGKKNKIRFSAEEKISFLINKGTADIEKELVIDKELRAPIKEGDALGSVIYRSGDKILYKLTITANESIEKKKINDVLRIIYEKIFLG